MTSIKYPHRLIAAGIITPLLLATAACGGDNAGNADSAGNTMAMADSAGASTGAMGGPNQAGQMDAPVAQLLATVNRAEISSGQLGSTKARNAEVKAFAQQMVQEHQAAMQTLTTLASTSGWSIDSAAIAGGMGGMSDSAHAMAGGAGTGGTGGTGAAGTGTGATGAAGTGATGTGTGMGGTGAAGTGTGGAGAGAGAGNLTMVMQQMQQSMATSMQQLQGQSGAAFDRAFMDAQLAAHQQTLDLLRQYGQSIQNTELRSHVTQMQGSVEQHLQQAKDIRQKLGGTTGGTGG
jgi:predicted outer membrane protein